MSAHTAAGVASSPGAFGESAQFFVRRDGDRDLCFTGWIIAQSADPQKDDTVEVKLLMYATTGGQLVTERRRYTCWERGVDGYTRKGEWRQASGDAVVHADAEDALIWLKEDNGGKLGRLGKALWEDACSTYPPLAENIVEVIS